jgi:hypothetical protein
MISDRIESGGKNRFLFDSVWKEIVTRNQCNRNDLFAEQSQTRKICTSILSGKKNKLLREINGAILERIESGGSDWKL